MLRFARKKGGEFSRGGACPQRSAGSQPWILMGMSGDEIAPAFATKKAGTENCRKKN
jgi:hypothetical protein